MSVDVTVPLHLESTWFHPILQAKAPTAKQPGFCFKNLSLCAPEQAFECRCPIFVCRCILLLADTFLVAMMKSSLEGTPQGWIFLSRKPSIRKRREKQHSRDLCLVRQTRAPYTSS